jgi:hypothetical protein
MPGGHPGFPPQPQGAMSGGGQQPGGGGYPQPGTMPGGYPQQQPGANMAGPGGQPAYPQPAQQPKRLDPDQMPSAVRTLSLTKNYFLF